MAPPELERKKMKNRIDYANHLEALRKTKERQFVEVTRAMASIQRPLTAHEAKALWTAYGLEDPDADSVKG